MEGSVRRAIIVMMAFMALAPLTACGGAAPSPSPTPAPSGAHLIWRGTLSNDQPIAGPDKPTRITKGGFWVSLTVSGHTGKGVNATVWFMPFPPASASPYPTALASSPVGRGWRVKDGDVVAHRVVVPPGTWMWSVQKGLGYSVKAAIYELP